ncbi:MAG: pyruvate, water dikinase [Deltaproteobacteria bacterium]|nr:pyruvate, water dikinase [Deltaproteobacteria bacterium]
MVSISKLFNRFFSGKSRYDLADAEEIRTDFKRRYHHFKLLLNSNNKALEIMTEMEEALKGVLPFGMQFVRSRCTAVSTNVWQIVRHLNELAPGRYKALDDRFKEIQTGINPFIKPKELPRNGPLVMPLLTVDTAHVDQVGSKMANLGELKKQLDVNISDGFVITAGAYHRFMEYNDLQAEIDRRIQATDVEDPNQGISLSGSIQQLIINSTLPEDVVEAIEDQYGDLEGRRGKGITVALRSSALGEDMAGVSFAGQYRSELNVSGENILDAYKWIIASKYSHTAMAYRLSRGIRDEGLAMCVGCTGMVDAVSGGVTYSRNPVDREDTSIVINSVWGLPKSVVDGSVASDIFIIDRTEPMRVIRKEIPFKEQKFMCYAKEGVCRMDMVGDKGGLASLAEEQAVELARLASKAEEYYGMPQDMEWAIDHDGSIIVLQCRPLQRTDLRKTRDSVSLSSRELNAPLCEGGLTASPGVSSGSAYIVQKEMDILQFPEGAVLVTSQALPRWAVLLSKAAGVVTEQGSIAGHLANVAREFGVPAIFGIPDIRNILKDGQQITMDADFLNIYDGQIDSLLKDRPSPRNLMEGSPIFEALKGAASKIVSLNLLDPASPAFRPENCKTLHDITRFCHEKSVEEMFRFGKDHHFPERSSKQLYIHVPMKWWILNLDDGFNEEVHGKHVRLENIASIPMLALWDGISAKPWEGPPPVDGKGFMSVMFRATTNTALVPGVRSKFADRNYFMISKNYCSLSSRLGFHFSIIEALVSERDAENYISFQFKGGAADDKRRYKRVLFIGEILEKYDFIINIREDNLIARIEGRDHQFMKDRLKLLGYLTIHTRQLDMIMANEASVNYYRSKIMNDIHDLIK